MDLELTEEQKMIQKTAREFAQEVIQPLVEEAEKEEKFPLELFPQMGELGFLGIPFPEEYGGIGADKVTQCLFVEEISKVCAGIAASVDAHCDLALSAIYRFGTQEQKERFLIPGIEGHKIGALAITEPNAGSDVAALQSTAKRKGDGYVLNGSKLFITNGSIADFVLVLAYLDKSQGAKKGMGLFIVEKDTPGFQVTRKLKGKMGHRSSDTAELAFEDCLVPAENLLGGEEGNGFMQSLQTLLGARISQAVKTVAIGYAAFEAALTYAKERKAFGQPISQFQAIQFKFANMLTRLEAARTYAFKVAYMYSRKMPCLKEAAMAKLMACEAAQFATYEAIQILGGYGYVDEYPVERFYRDVRLSTITEGTTEIQCLIIARELGL
ncbi:acyl-CoA dehydrogenase family protein [Desulfofundulus thermocisternus]|uniref:acyl-CoA dehydrogenase family protein n=1 Tax=Desulfofundulus thermocisternus TaxID=42471 RepID=UPI00217D1243|nr:acyl-CoA dehydrogenase family protein [Desulfofundulus thermocisternus]MCS5695034.1 acyl-CoA dehydrogenase family protein [Desulfofundulus thermocisternus]